MKIGVYGGSFNPCHIMHYELVTKLLNLNYFDRIIILPTGNFYKKSNLLKGEYRLKMLELMFNDNNRVIICDYEFKNNLICTYRSMDYLQNLYKGDKLYFITGSDNLQKFNTWKRYEYILDTYNLFVIDRKGIDIKRELEEFSKYKGDIINIDLNLAGISSGEIRDSFMNNDLNKARSLLAPKVYDYIISKGFYLPNYKDEDEICLTDEDFLKQYNSDSYEKISLTTDISLFGVSDIQKDNYRKIDKKSFSVLLVKRRSAPFYNKWCLPGGFLSLDETLIDCAKRVLFTETNLDDIYLEQLYTLSEIDRDIRARVLSCSYMGLVDKSLIESKLNSNASFFMINIENNNDIYTLTFNNNTEEFSCLVKKEVDSYGIVSYEIIQNDYLAFDHLKIIATSIERLRSKISYTDLVFHMMPKLFTLKELQLVYEAILGKKLLDPVFRRTIKSKVLKTDKLKTDGGHRPAVLFKYKGDKDE